MNRKKRPANSGTTYHLQYSTVQCCTELNNSSTVFFTRYVAGTSMPFSVTSVLHVRILMYMQSVSWFLFCFHFLSFFSSFFISKRCSNDGYGVRYAGSIGIVEQLTRGLNTAPRMIIQVVIIIIVSMSKVFLHNLCTSAPCTHECTFNNGAQKY